MSIKDELYRPIEDIDSRRGRGGTYDYVKWQYVADRMNEVFGMNWSSHVEYQEVMGDTLIVRISVCARDPETGQQFCQEGYGGSKIQGGEEPGSSYKGAYSKALKDACKKWGVGLHLDGGDNQSSSGSSVPNGYMGHTTGAPPAPGNPAPTPSAPVPGNSGAPAPNTPVAPQSTAPAPGPAPTSASPSGPALGAPAPTQAPQTATNYGTAPPAQPQAPAPVQGVPAQTAPATPAPNNTAPAPAGGTEDQSPDAPGTLTNVQEMAIRNLSKMNGAEDDEAIVTNILTRQEIGLTRQVHNIKDLSYNEAVSVIKNITNLQ